MLEVPDGRLQGLPALEPASLLIGQDLDLLELFGQRVAVRGVAREAVRTHHQAMPVGDGHAHLHAELVRFPGPGLLHESLLQRNACAPGCGHHLVAGNLQQARVHRVVDGLLLHGGVHDHTLELGRLNGPGGNGGVDGGLQEFLDSGLTDGGAKAPDLAGIAGQPRLVEGHAAEVLPDHVLGPAPDQFLVAELVGVLEVQQAGHKTNGQAGATCCDNRLRLPLAPTGRTARAERRRAPGASGGRNAVPALPRSVPRAGGWPAPPAGGADRSSRPKASGRSQRCRQARPSTKLPEISV